MRVTDIEVDDDNEEHLTAHGVTLTEIHQVFANKPVIRRNRRGRTATHIAVGLTNGGRRVIIPFIHRDTTARPITAWEEGK